MESGNSVLKDAFGVVSLVALLPIISVEIVGFIYSRKPAAVMHEYSDFDVVDLWEEA